jgi:hypothetical protein
MPCPSHPPWLDHSNYTWRRVQVMKLLIKQIKRSYLFARTLHPESTEQISITFCTDGL